MPGFFSPSELTVIEAPQSTLPKCGLCGLYKTCKSPKMRPSGHGRKRFLIVGEAPGQDEDSRNRPFVGRAGQLLRQKAKMFGIDLERDCHITNALICRPPNNKIPNDKVVGYCRPNLVKTIKELKPDVVILLGETAVKSCLALYWKKTGDKLGSITRWAGYKIPHINTNTWFCPTYHPSFVLRSEREPVVNILFEKHLSDAFSLRDRPFEKVPDYESMVRVYHDPDRAIKKLERLKDGDVIAFDFEANMLKPESDKYKLYTCSVNYKGVDGWTIAFPWFGKVVKLMKQILANPRIKKIASNLKYEDRVSEVVLGVDVKGWLWDTMISAHHLENATKKRKITSIKFQAFVHLGVEDYDAHIAPYLKGRGGANSVNQIHKVDLGQLLLYNGMDSLLEYEVARRQIPRAGGML